MNARDELAYRIHDSAVAVNGQWAIRSGAATDAVIEFLTNDEAVGYAVTALRSHIDDLTPAEAETIIKDITAALLGEGE